MLRLLLIVGPMSRLEIGQHTDLSPGTITNIISDLLDEGIVLETGLVESASGRPRTTIAINPEYGYLIGVDLGETHIQMELFNLGWQKLGMIRTMIVNGDTSPHKYVEMINDGVNELVARADVRTEDILGIGVGVPGIVVHNGGVRIAAPMWAWQSVDLLHPLENRTGIPSYFDNGVKGMALAEAWFGAGRGVQNMAVVLIGTGVGAGVITQGALYRGATNSAGEWGHTKIVLDGRPCRCGSRGCVEAYVGALGIIKSLNEAGFQDADAKSNQFSSIKKFVDALHNKEPIAEEALCKTTNYLGVGLANLVNLFNPELIVIGGWVSLLLGETILDDLRKVVAQYALPPSVTHLKIGLSKFGQDAVCTGAACLILEEYLNGNQKFHRRTVVPPQEKL